MKHPNVTKSVQYFDHKAIEDQRLIPLIQIMPNPQVSHDAESHQRGRLPVLPPPPAGRRLLLLLLLLWRLRRLQRGGARQGRAQPRHHAQLPPGAEPEVPSGEASKF